MQTVCVFRIKGYEIYDYVGYDKANINIELFFFSSSSFGFPLVRSAAILMGAERFVATAFQFLFIS